MDRGQVTGYRGNGGPRTRHRSPRKWWAADKTQVTEEMVSRRPDSGNGGNGWPRNQRRLSRKWRDAELAKVIEEILGCGIDAGYRGNVGSAQTQVIDGRAAE